MVGGLQDAVGKMRKCGIKMRNAKCEKLVQNGVKCAMQKFAAFGDR